MRLAYLEALPIFAGKPFPLFPSEKKQTALFDPKQGQAYRGEQ